MRSNRSRSLDRQALGLRILHPPAGPTQALKDTTEFECLFGPSRPGTVDESARSP